MWFVLNDCSNTFYKILKIERFVKIILRYIGSYIVSVYLRDRGRRVIGRTQVKLKEIYGRTVTSFQAWEPSSHVTRYAKSSRGFMTLIVPPIILRRCVTLNRRADSLESSRRSWDERRHCSKHHHTRHNAKYLQDGHYRHNVAIKQSIVERLCYTVKGLWQWRRPERLVCGDKSQWCRTTPQKWNTVWLKNYWYHLCDRRQRQSVTVRNLRGDDSSNRTFLFVRDTPQDVTWWNAQHV